MVSEEIKLTATQQSAVDMVADLFKQTDFPKITILSGYAGTGKTTTIKQIVQFAKNLGGKVVLLAPTGKAGVRITEATGFEASTIHRWCYKPVEDEKTGETTFVIRKPDLLESKSGSPTLVIIDEASMVTREVLRDVYRVCKDFRCHLLLVGDSFQLPPVAGREEKPFSVFNNEIPVHKRVNLVEVMRQALDNPIIRASMLVREGKVQDALNMLPRVERDAAVATTNDIIRTGGVSLCYTNRLRHFLNNEIRKLRGYGDDIKPNEPLLITRNSYDINRFNGEVLNFEGFQSLSSPERVYDFYKKVETHARFGIGKLEGEVVGVSPDLVQGKLDEFNQKAVLYSWRTAARDLPNSKSTKPRKPGVKKYDPFVPFVFANFGYALTAHKSQGSEWPNVIVFLERSIRHNTEEGQRWIYTSITRAQKKVFITLE